MSIVALSGYGGVGKDAAYELLAEHGWQRAAFADKIRETALALDPFVQGDIRLSGFVRGYGWTRAKETVPEVRRILQLLGTEVGREIFGSDVWINLTFRAMGPGNYVITDCRFPDEANAVRMLGGKVIRINRPGVGPANQHASETALDDYPFFAAVIVNDDTLDVFRERLLEAIA